MCWFCSLVWLVHMQYNLWLGLWTRGTQRRSKSRALHQLHSTCRALQGACLRWANPRPRHDVCPCDRTPLHHSGRVTRSSAVIWAVRVRGSVRWVRSTRPSYAWHWTSRPLCRKFETMRATWPSVHQSDHVIDQGLWPGPVQPLSNCSTALLCVLDPSVLVDEWVALSGPCHRRACDCWCQTTWLSRGTISLLHSCRCIFHTALLLRVARIGVQCWHVSTSMFGASTYQACQFITFPNCSLHVVKCQQFLICHLFLGTA